MVCMELLAKLLGGYERVKIMRYFLHQDDVWIDGDSLSYRVKSKDVLVKKELAALFSLGFLQKKKGKTLVIVGKKGETKTKEATIFALDTTFPHVGALSSLLFDFKNLDKKEIASRFKHVGRIKLFVLAGVFVESEKSRVDILIVGESIGESKVEKLVEGLSAELGRPVTFIIMDTEEFEYRKKMYDKFVGDIFSMDHEIIINKLEKGVK